MRLIDADKVVEEINKAINSRENNRKNDFIRGVVTGLESATYFMEDAPTVEERPHGEWLDEMESSMYEGLYISTCSACKCQLYTEEFHAYFCPHCGADMRVKGR